ncbi:hypothetical protein ANN_06437 [Periplaneta americana]|uniref:Phorbol-ester/DAG-type domain-containing protein n=1 Tax=Periplaneta americana TaxID=6978 RepID=A0ABQ8TDI9_PERAM|nr:hypothetical protein ANN_06437 [Periplaneta americana]
MAVNEVKINSSSASLCKRCKRKVVNGVKCIDCESYFHNSCASFITNIKILDANTVKCCDMEEDNDCDEVFSNMLKGITDEGKIDINIFKYIIRQKDCIIAELREKVKLLTQHVELLTMVKDGSSLKQMKIDTSPKCDNNIKVVQTTNENPGTSTVGSNSDPSNGSDINKVSFADVVKGRKMKTDYIRNGCSDSFMFADDLAVNTIHKNSDILSMELADVSTSIRQNASYEVYEEVGCVSSDGSTRRADIIIIDRQKDKGVILDPTTRFEMHEQQPQEQLRRLAAAIEEKRLGRLQQMLLQHDFHLFRPLFNNVQENPFNNEDLYKLGLTTYLTANQ